MKWMYTDLDYYVIDDLSMKKEDSVDEQLAAASARLKRNLLICQETVRGGIADEDWQPNTEDFDGWVIKHLQPSS